MLSRSLRAFFLSLLRFLSLFLTLVRLTPTKKFYVVHPFFLCCPFLFRVKIQPVEPFSPVWPVNPIGPGR